MIPLQLLRASISRGLLQQGRALSTTPAARGLEDFFDSTVKEGEKVTAGAQAAWPTVCSGFDPINANTRKLSVPYIAGRGWTAADLRGKSWDDLHKLWYVLLKERNMLRSEKDAYRARGLVMPNGNRMTKVWPLPTCSSAPS
jgi:large subunit ribosomal protein L47